MSSLKVAVSLDAGPDFAAFRQSVKDCEAAGVDVIMVPEAYGIDAVSILGFLAGVTERVELMSGIVPIFSRTPALLAMTAAGLDLASSGRFSLGIGVSGPQVVEGWHAVPYDAPLGRTREIIEICRKVWRRELLEHAGKNYTIPLPEDQGSGKGKALKLVHRPIRQQIPIYIAALGPGNVQLAAEKAEGWIPFLYVPERADRVWGEPVKRGLEKRDPALGRFEIVTGGPMAIGPDAEHLREDDRGHLAMYVGGMGARGANFYNRVVSEYGWEEEAARVQNLYLDGHRAEAAAAIPNGLLEGTSLIGDESYIRDRLAAYQSRGVTVAQVTPIGPDPQASLRRFCEIAHSL